MIASVPSAIVKMHTHLVLLGLLLLPLCVSSQTQLAAAFLQNATICSTAGVSGPCTDLTAYSSNLRYLSQQVLPVGWKLNAVVKVWQTDHSSMRFLLHCNRIHHSYTP
jgi:hypothetical protein